MEAHPSEYRVAPETTPNAGGEIGEPGRHGTPGAVAGRSGEATQGASRVRSGAPSSERSDAPERSIG